MDLIRPDWPAPARVQACFTSRQGGVSDGVFAGLNLGAHVDDDPQRVAENRRQLRAQLQLTQEPIWLTQVHGTKVYPVREAAEAQPAIPPQADAAVTRLSGVPLTVMTADCLPVLFCDDDASVVAAAHAGWRGLAAGVLENTVREMGVPPHRLRAWLGPAIGAEAFEVGDEVRAAFVADDAGAAAAFVARPLAGKWLADLFMLARRRLVAAGVTRISGGGVCTVAAPQRFYSYRRDGVTGRFASMVWLDKR